MGRVKMHRSGRFILAAVVLVAIELGASPTAAGKVPHRGEALTHCSPVLHHRQGHRPQGWRLVTLHHSLDCSRSRTHLCPGGMSLFCRTSCRAARKCTTS